MKKFAPKRPRHSEKPSSPSVSKKVKGPSPIPKQAPGTFPMRINKYLAMKGHSTRRGADELVEKKFVIINGRTALLGDQVNETDIVEVRRNGRGGAGNKNSKVETLSPVYVYYAFNKPPGIQLETAARSLPLQDVFPVLPLDREAQGLVILTNDRRIIDRLSNAAALHVAENAHMKEYLIRTHRVLKNNFKEKLERGVVLAGKNGKSGGNGSHAVTIDCKIHVIKDNLFTLRTTDNGNHIRHVCSLFMAEIQSLTRTNIGTLELGSLGSGQFRPIDGEEKEIFLKELGL